MLDPSRLVFIDETSVSTTITRLFGRAPQGERLVQKVLHGNWKTLTFIAALRHGVGRETAHDAISEHAIAVALQMRETGQVENDLLDRLAADPRLGVTRTELDAAIADPVQLAGAAGRQVAALATQIETIAEAYPEAAAYQPGPVL